MRQAPNRVATVIIYLRSAGEGGARPAGGEEPLSGGDTLFPCLRAPALGGDGGGALRTAMSARHCAAWASVRAGPTAAPRWSSTIGTLGNSVARACSAGTASARRQHADMTMSQEQRE